MRGQLQESDIRAGLQAGGRIESVVIIARQDQSGGTEHVPYLLPSWRRGYIAIGLFRGPGVRTYRDLTRLVRFLRDDLGFRGPISLHEAGCTKLAKLRSLLPGPASGSQAPGNRPHPAAIDTAAQDTSDM